MRPFPRLTGALALVLLVAGCSDAPTAPDVPPAPEATQPPPLAPDRVETLSGDQVIWSATDVPDTVPYDAADNEGTISLYSNLPGAPGGGLDIMVAMDASGSVGRTGWEQEKNFVSDLVGETLPAPPTGLTRMGIVQFSTGSTLEWALTDNQDPTVVANLVQSLSWTQGYTYTKDAVQQVIQHFNSASTAERGKLMVLITDGVPYPTTQDPCSLKTQLAGYGIKTVIVGVGNFDTSRIDCLVDDPVQDLIAVQDFGNLDWQALRQQLNTYLDPTVSNVSVSGTIPGDFDVNSFNDPATVSYDPDTGDFTWAVGDVSRTPTDLSVLFDVDHGVPQVCGARALFTNLVVTYDDADGNTQTQALPDAALEVGGCPPPVVTPVLEGDLGDGGWYTSDVTLHWDVSQVDQSATWDCPAVTVDEDTPAGGTDFACDATSPYGDVTGSVNIKRDATPPVITFAGNAGTYTIGDQIQISCTAEDAASGIASADCPSVEAPATDYAEGEHTLNATATDAAGNTATASTTFEVILDHTPPVIEPVITGTAGANGWYVSPVTVGWSVTDPESAIASETGCADVTVDHDTPGATFTCTASSAGGEASASATVAVDLTPPDVAFTGNAGTYGVADLVQIDCAASDATSGIDAGATSCPGVSSAGWELGTGSHTLNATATDLAGNTASASTSFTVEVDVAGIGALAGAWVTGPGAHGVVNSLLAKLSGRHPNVRAFINEVRAQTGKRLTEEQAQVLIDLASQL